MTDYQRGHEAGLRDLLIRAIVEIGYMHCAEHISQVESAEGKSILYDGMKLLGLKDLSEESVAAIRALKPQPTPSTNRRAESADVTISSAHVPVESQETTTSGSRPPARGEAETPAPQTDARLFNCYTRMHRGLVFSKRMRIVAAMEKAMLEAEAIEAGRSSVTSTPTQPIKFADWCDSKMITPTMDAAEEYARDMIRRPGVEQRSPQKEISRLLRLVPHIMSHGDSCDGCKAASVAKELLSGGLTSMPDGNNAPVYERGSGAKTEPRGSAVEQRSQPDGWISVAEILPEFGSRVLVFRPERWEQPYDIVEYTQKSEDHRKFTRRDGQWWDSGKQITHWQALPVPPGSQPDGEKL